MESPLSSRGRSERLIAVGRIVLATSSLLALWRDPSEPAKYAAIAYALLVAYLVYALVLSVVGWRSAIAGGTYGLLVHCFDLVFFSAFMYFTSGPASPFIAYFVFALVCATLRWQWRGTLWTAVASLAAYFGLGLYFAGVLHDPTFEPNEFVIRGVYMAVVAYLLGHLGLHEQRTREEMALLASWPSRPSGSIEELLRRVLEHTARVHRTSRAALAWRPTMEPSSQLRLVVWSGGDLSWPELSGATRELVAAALADASLLASPASGGSSEVLVRAASELRRWRGEPFGRPMSELLGPGRTLSAPWRGELAEGRIFLPEMADATADDLLLAEVVAALVGAQLDGFLFFERRREEAATEERIRLARDLHDGVLQSLAAVGLRVAAARRLLAEAPADARRSLDALQRMVAVEQRDLRFFIQDLEPPPGGARDFDLASRLAELFHRVEQEWQLRVELETEALEDELPEEAERDLYFIVREALVNAVRHGQAERVRVRIARLESDRIELVIEDDGSGFPVQGRFDQNQLAALRTGPRSLRERVVARGGTLRVDSSEGGVRLEVEVPL